MSPTPEPQAYATWTTPAEEAAYFRALYKQARDDAERAEMRANALESQIWHLRHPGYDEPDLSPPIAAAVPSDVDWEFAKAYRRDKPDGIEIDEHFNVSAAWFRCGWAAATKAAQSETSGASEPPLEQAIAHICNWFPQESETWRSTLGDLIRANVGPLLMGFPVAAAQPKAPSPTLCAVCKSQLVGVVKQLAANAGYDPAPSPTPVKRIRAALNQTGANDASIDAASTRG